MEKELEKQKKKLALFPKENDSVNDVHDEKMNTDKLDDSNNPSINMFNTENKTHSYDVNKLYNTLQIPNFVAFEEQSEMDAKTSYTQAEEWILKIEDIFEPKNTPESEKSKFASATLEGSSYSWYALALKKSNKKVVPGEEFKILLKILISEISQIYNNFKILNLKMGSKMTIRDYTSQFWKIKYHSMIDKSEQLEMSRYMNGLPARMKDVVLRKYLKKLATSIKMAYAAELDSIPYYARCVKF